jgi:hypothetical protein
MVIDTKGLDMRKLIGLLVGILATACLSIALATTPESTTTATPEAIPSPAGSWQTIDDVTNQPRSIVLITVDSANQLTGKLTKINYRPGEGPNDVCSKCSGSLHNQKILGMTILTDMKQNPGNSLQWVGGRIVDPESGKTYDCKITLSADGNTLKVRGFIGFSILGRTQTWHRIS